MGYEDMSENEREESGCIAAVMLSFVVLAASFVIGGMFGWYWGVGCYFGTIGLFGLWLICRVLRNS